MSFAVTGQPLTEWTKLTDNTLTTIFTARKNTTIIGISATELAGSTSQVTILRSDGSNSFYLRKALAVTAKQHLTFDEVFQLGTGDTIKAQTNDAAGNLDCAVTYLNPDATALGRSSALGG